MKRPLLLSIMLILISMTSLNAQLRNDDVYKMTDLDHSNIRRELVIPGFDGYVTLKCDFHIHTIFSDGDVWPSTRVDEAWQEGLDAIAITDHIEGYPAKVEGDHNSAFRIAKERGDSFGFIVIQGAEISRSKPLGHLNALFINDANKMDVEDPLEAIDAALEQGGFIEWNHPGWPDDLSTIYPVHEKLLEEGKIHGIEVVNCLEYYPVTFDWCNKYNLPPLSNSDIHGIIYGDYRERLRPMTLVFAADRSEKAIKDALFAGRTAAFYNGNLFAKEEYLVKLVEASLQLRFINEGYVEITNTSDISYEVTNGVGVFYLPARMTTRIRIPSEGDLVFQNCYVGMNRKLTIPYESWSDLVVPSPVITPAKGLFSGKATVSIKGGKADEVIYYTTDGSLPTEQSARYEGPFELTRTSIVKAIVCRNGQNGGISSAFIRVVSADIEPKVAYKYYEKIPAYSTKLPDFKKLGAPTRSGYIHEIGLDELDIDDRDQFAVLFTTKLMIDEAGLYKFGLNADDGAKLYIDGKLVVDNDGSHAAILKTGSIQLKKGLHNVRIEFYDDCEDQLVELTYESEKIVNQPVPTEKFRR